MRHTIKNGVVTRRGFLARSAAAAATLALGRFAGAAAPTKAAPWNAAMELAVTFTTFASTGGRYQRPYVAVWIEDASGKPVRTVSLWMLNPPRGNRYLDELRRWFTAASSTPALTGTTTSPTRQPGTYTVVWDGKDDQGKAVPQGAYTVNVESAREHGPYSLTSARVTLAATPLKQNLADNAELKDVKVEYRKHA